MSERREKKRRREARAEYAAQLERWRRQEPPWWRLIAHWLWRKDKPVLPGKGA